MEIHESKKLFWKYTILKVELLYYVKTFLTHSYLQIPICFNLFVAVDVPIKHLFKCNPVNQKASEYSNDQEPPRPKNTAKCGSPKTPHEAPKVSHLHTHF